MLSPVKFSYGKFNFNSSSKSNIKNIKKAFVSEIYIHDPAGKSQVGCLFVIGPGIRSVGIKSNLNFFHPVSQQGPGYPAYEKSTGRV